MHSYSTLKENFSRKHNARLTKTVGPATLKYYQRISTKLAFNDYLMKKKSMNKLIDE